MATQQAGEIIGGGLRRWTMASFDEPTLMRRAARNDSASPGTLYGTVVRYGDQALIKERLWESFVPGSFEGLDSEDVYARYFHDRTQPLGLVRPPGYKGGGGILRLEDTPEELRAELILPDTMRGRDVAAEVDAGILRGWSVEFSPLRSQMDHSDPRKPQVRRLKNKTRGVGVVDTPAYRGSHVYMRDDYEEDDGWRGIALEQMALIRQILERPAQAAQQRYFAMMPMLGPEALYQGAPDITPPTPDTPVGVNLGRTPPPEPEHPIDGATADGVDHPIDNTARPPGRLFANGMQVRRRIWL